MQLEPDNPQAFPRATYVELSDEGHAPPFKGEIQTAEGMSLRDYYAGKALASLVAPAFEGAVKQRRAPEPYVVALETARACYKVADAMLEARAEKGGHSGL